MEIKPTSNLVKISNELNTSLEQPVYTKAMNEHMDILKPESNSVIDIYA